MSRIAQKAQSSATIKEADASEFATLCREFGVSLSSSNVASSDRLAVGVSITFENPLPPLAQAIIASKVMDWCDDQHRQRGGAGLRRLDSPVSPSTEYLLKTLSNDDSVLLHTGVREAPLKKRNARVVYVDRESPYGKALMKNEGTLLTRLGGMHVQMSVEAKTVSGLERTLRHSVLPVFIPKDVSKFERVQFGACLRHEIAHLEGADELAARLAGREYLRRQGLKGPTDKQIFLQLFAVNLMTTLLRKPKYCESDLVAASNYAWKESRISISRERLAARAMGVLLKEGWYRLSQEMG